MFPPSASYVAFALVIFIPVVVKAANITSYRRTRDFRQFRESPSVVQNYRREYHPSKTGSASPRAEPIYYYDSPHGSSGSSASNSDDGYKPGPPPESIYQGYFPGHPPFSSSFNAGYKPASTSYDADNPSILQYYGHNHHSSSSQQNDEPPTYPSGSLGYHPGLSPYGHHQHQSHPPANYPFQSPSFSSSGYQPNKPPSSHHPYGHHHSYPGWSSASASAIAGHGAAAASSSVSSSNPGFTFWPPPSNYPPPEIHPSPSSGYPSPSNDPPTGPSPSHEPEKENIYGWGPPPPPPYKPVPEFSYQFSLKPSAFGWETSYNVPCGNYQIQPRVMAHLRLATQAMLPKNSASSNEYTGREKRRRKRNQPIPPLKSFLDPFRLERTLQSYTPYHSQPFTQPRPTFRPRTCRWNFNAAEGCKLNFKCSWFQLPALFRCDENYLHLTDNTILLDKTFCGNRRPRMDQIFSSNSGKLALTFKSRGAALPAILDCTVLCTPDDELNSGIELNPTEASTDDPSSSLLGYQPTLHPSFPIIAHQHALVSSASTNKEQQRKNSTIIIKHPPSKPQLRMGNCRCGVPDSNFSAKVVHGRIVGGSSMMPGESPWTAALVKWNSNRPYCGASLINNRFLLTAAHCVLNHSRRAQGGQNGGTFTGGNNRTDAFEKGIYFDVLLNEHDISQPNEIAGGTIRAKVDKVIVHPNYDNVTFSFDAALIRLADPIEFNSWTERKVPLAQIYKMNSGNNASSSNSPVGKNNPPPRHQQNNSNTHRLFHNMFDFHSLRRKKRFLIPEIEAREIPPKPVPICLPDPESTLRNGKSTQDDEDNYAIVTGWGLVAEGGTPSAEMLKARVQIFNDSICQDLYKKHNYVITDSMMCAGYINGKIDSCVGDSGSPLAIENKDRFVLTGMVSWGRGCGRKQLPGVYTKVTELRDWIYSEASSTDAIWCE